LNSNETILLPIRIVCVKRNGVGAINLADVQGRGITFKGDFSTYSKQKKSIVQINPSNDEFNRGEGCFAQWIVLGLSLLVFMSRIPPVASLNIDHRTYSKLTKSSCKFRYRKDLSTRLVELLNITAMNE
jgi:hypothetical protein